MRLDKAIFDKKLAQSRSRAEMLILSGAVKVNGRVITKPAHNVEDDDDIFVEDIAYVGRGGLKLEGALDEFNLDVNGLVALDIGASTGGFTQCLLMRGAKKVYAIDVGHGQMASELANDARVELFEDTNARDIYLQMFSQKPDIAVMDVSFISQTALYEALFTCVDCVVALVKPQFELEKKFLTKKGIVKDKKLYPLVFKKIEQAAQNFGMQIEKTCVSSILGGDGNKEFFVLLTKGNNVFDVEKFFKGEQK